MIQKILHADDTPHAIALGTAVATFIAFLPLVGLQTIIAISLAAALRANKAVCVPIVWITNPFTLGPIYLACFGLGRWVMASPQDTESVVVLNELSQQQQLSVLTLEFWKDLFSRLAGLGLDLWIGCTIVGIVLGIASYIAALWGVSTYREKRRLRLLRKGLLRSKTDSIQVTRPADMG